MHGLLAFKSHYQTIKVWYKKYERWLMPATLAAGFAADYITFVNIEINTALVILFVYWIVCAFTIAFVHAFDAGKIPNRFKYLRLFAPLLIQFTFGGLLSNSFIFYWFSGSVWVSWPFILAFVLLMISNDALRHYFLKPVVQLSVYFFASFSILSVILPFRFNSLDPRLFVLAGGLALIFISLYIWLLRTVAGKEKFRLRNLAVSIALIYIIVNLFYFLNLIPPIPLALREMGVYHSIQKRGGAYVLKGEPQSFWQKILPGQTLHLQTGERAYVFSSIFAPKNLNILIFHEWQYYNESTSEWITKDRLSFTLVGGRREGFRGYSLKSSLPDGKWRVFIKTRRGQTLGRVRFNIERVATEAELKEVIR